jgi:prepilin-type N-terminal cleavage/methylation domain-containing protein
MKVKDMTQAKSERGFTIVELLIVIVVIGILAAITLVAYNGIQARANKTAAESTANSVYKKIVAYQSIKTDYPTSTTQLNAADVKESNLESGTSVGTPDATNGKSTVRVWTCANGAAVAYWDYTSSAAAKAPTTAQSAQFKAGTVPSDGAGCTAWTTP